VERLEALADREGERLRRHAVRCFLLAGDDDLMPWSSAAASSNDDGSSDESGRPETTVDDRPEEPGPPPVASPPVRPLVCSEPGDGPPPMEIADEGHFVQESGAAVATRALEAFGIG